MLHQERVKLLFGPYRMPKCKTGGVLRCQVRGTTKVFGITAAPIQWPFGKTPRGRGGRLGLIVCGDLARAIRLESESAIAYHWQVSIFTVSRWRRALGVSAFTPGTRDLYRRWLPEKLDEKALRNQKEARSTPEFRARMSEAQRGRPMPEHVKRKLLKANKGRKASAESRHKMSEAHKRRGTRPPTTGSPWTEEEVCRLGTMSDQEVAEAIGRTHSAVYTRRRRLKIPNVAPRRAPCQSPIWTPAKDRLLGTMPDPKVARKLRCSSTCVRNRRRHLKITPFRDG